MTDVWNDNLQQNPLAPFDEAGFYGNGTAAGFKGNSPIARETGREAAQAVTGDLPRRHKQMLEAWRPYGAVGARPEEIAGDLGLPVHVVRPRAGELVKRNLLFEVGKRMGTLGSKVTVYSVFRPAEPETVAA